jgi:hypothetical protein
MWGMLVKTFMHVKQDLGIKAVFTWLWEWQEHACYTGSGQAGATAYTTSTVSVDNEHTSSILHWLESTARRGLRVCSQESESKKKLRILPIPHMDIFILQRPYYMQLDLEMLRTILVLSNKNCLVTSNKKNLLYYCTLRLFYIYISIMAYIHWISV